MSLAVALMRVPEDKDLCSLECGRVYQASPEIVYLDNVLDEDSRGVAVNRGGLRVD